MLMLRELPSPVICRLASGGGDGDLLGFAALKLEGQGGAFADA